MNFNRIFNSLNFFEENDKWIIDVLDNFYEKDYDELKNLSNDDIIQLLQSTGIINSSIRCTSCNDSLSNVYYASDRHPYFRCNKRRVSRKK